jgi:iron complex outermembrane recepter protein
LLTRLPAAFLLAATAASAQATPPEPSTAPTEGRSNAGFSEDVTVTGTRSVLQKAQSIGVLTREDLRRNEGIFLDDTLNLIPGVRFESRTASGGQRITIRGYGNNTNFNGTGYKAYLDGIPITDAEGTTILDDLDFSMLGRLEVIKGPASSLYGTGIGGVVRFFTLEPRPNLTQVTQELVGGETALFRSNTRFENGSDNSTFLLNYGHQHSDGYRIHSLSNKDYVLLTGDYRASDRQSISYLASYNHSFDQLAGQLTEAQFNARQNVAEAAYLANNGHVGIDSLRFGVAHQYQFAPWLGNVTSAFGTGYQLNQPFAVGLSDNLVINYGARTEFSGRFETGSVTWLPAIGSELERTTSFKKSYGLTNGVVGGVRGDLQVVALQSNTFIQTGILLPSEFTVTAGASLNYVRYAITDRLANSANPTHPDGSGVKSFDPVITPRIAVQRSFGPDLSAYAQVSQGYSPPTSANVVIPQIGAVNLDLKPERGTLFEVGSKGLLLGQRFAYEVALFDMRITDKLTPQSITDSSGSVLYTITTNAGSQTNLGLELSLKYALFKDANAPLSLLQAFVGYTYSHFRYDDFKSDNNNNAQTINYDGKKVVGVPDHIYGVGLDAASRWGVYGNTTLQVIGAMPLTFDNAHSAKGYSLLNAKVGWRRELPARFRLDLALGVKNITDETYYTMVFLNASYAGPPPNIYLPGPGRTLWGGFNLSKAL